MTPRVLFIITSDPRHSARPAEAARIAAGVGVWKKADITVYLREEAILALGEAAGEWVDGDDFAQYWPMLAGSIYVQKNSATLKKIGPAGGPFQKISDDQLAELAAAQNCVLRF